ncbi:hypothetical protein D3C86_1159240 [compost metagenome]
MNHLINSLLFGFLFLLPLEPSAQESGTYSNISFSIRGKYLLGGFLEDLYWRGYNYGGEIYIGKHHAVGIDGGVFRTRRERDDDKDAAMYSDITRRSYIYLDYKYIYPFNNQFSLYGQVYSKVLGKRMDWSEKADYDFGDSTDLTFLEGQGRGTFTDIGLGVGCKFYFGESNFGFDASLNVYKRFEKFNQTNYVYSEGDGWEWNSSQIKESPVALYLRMTFFYHFLRFKRKQ